MKTGAEAEFFDKKTAKTAAENFTEEELLAVLDAAFEISANEIYNLNAALTEAYFTTIFAK